MALSCAAAFVVAYLTLVHSLAGQRADIALGDRLALVNDGIGVLLFAWGFLSPVFLAVVAWHGWTLVGRGPTLLAVGVASTVVVAAETFKDVLPRPPLPFESAGSGFPSGHTAVAGTVAIAAVTLTASVHRWRIAVAWAAAQLLVALGLVADRWHRPSDVVGSLLLTAAAAAVAEGWVRPRVVTRLARRCSTPAGTPQPPGTRPTPPVTPASHRPDTGLTPA